MTYIFLIKKCFKLITNYIIIIQLKILKKRFILKIINGVQFTPEMMYKSSQMYYSVNTRCYNSKFHEKYPSYIGCINNFKDIDDFRSWLIDNEYFNYDSLSIDKDILSFNGNMIYSRDNCTLIPNDLNQNLTSISKSFDSTKIYTNSAGNFQLKMSVDNKKVHFQCYSNQQDFIDNKRYTSSYKILKYIELNKNNMPDISYFKIINSKFYEFISSNSKLIDPKHKIKIDNLI